MHEHRSITHSNIHKACEQNAFYSNDTFFRMHNHLIIDENPIEIITFHSEKKTHLFNRNGILILIDTRLHNSLDNI